MRVLVLHGGNSNERDVSLRSGNAVARAVQTLGHEYTLADPAAKDFNLKNLLDQVNVVFIALHGAGGEDGTIQAELEQAGKPFVGCDSKASNLCFDKWAYKQLLQSNNLPASQGQLISKNNAAAANLDEPFVLKPIRGGSSLDTLIVRHPDESTQAQVTALLSKYPDMLFEPMITGIEITVGILNQEPLPVVEIKVPDGLEFDYENKYNGKTEEICPPENVSAADQLRAQELALQVHNLCGCRHISRTDMILDASGNFHILETNTIPGFTEASLYPLMAKQAGYTMPQLVDTLLQCAL